MESLNTDDLHDYNIVGWGFDVAPSELKDGLLLAPGAFLANLCRAGGPVRRSGARRPRRI